MRGAPNMSAIPIQTRELSSSKNSSRTKCVCIALRNLILSQVGLLYSRAGILSVLSGVEQLLSSMNSVATVPPSVTDKIEYSPYTLQEAVSGFLFAPSSVFGLTSTACPSPADYFPALVRAFCAEGAYCSVVSRGACCRSGWAEDHA